MKAIHQDEYGPPESVLGFATIEAPTMGDADVFVRVRAAGVNWADWSMTRGIPYMLRLGTGLRKPRRGVRGTDVAGTVEAVGQKVTQLAVGDDVFGWCTGAFAEYVSAPATNFVMKPAQLGFDQAAATPLAGSVALQALRDVGNVRPGQQVLVNGASGGIGTFTVQIAKALGAEVTGVCSSRNMEMVHSLGADHVIDYTKGDFTRGTRRYDFILDMPDNRSLAERRRVLTASGTLIPNSGVGGRWVGSLGRIVKARLISPFVRHKLHPFLSLSKHDDLVALTELIESGAVTPVIDRTYPLVEAASAIAYVGAGHTRGKVVITV